VRTMIMGEGSSLILLAAGSGRVPRNGYFFSIRPGFSVTATWNGPSPAKPLAGECRRHQADLQPQLPCAVLPKQIALPNVTPYHLN
jgi:hypothetical protein